MGHRAATLLGRRGVTVDAIAIVVVIAVAIDLDLVREHWSLSEAHHHR